jgi:MFS family permease
MDKNPPDDFNEQNEGSFLTSPKKKKPSLFNLRTFSSLKNPLFRRFYVALLAQRASLNIFMISQSLLIYRLTGSAILLGVVNLVFSLTLLVSSPFGGAIADRVSKKTILLSGRIVIILLRLGIAVALTIGYLSSGNTNSWWLLIISTAISGIASGFTMPASQAIIPEMVGKKLLMNAVALSNLAMSVLRLIGPAIAGFLIDAYDFHVVFFTMAGLNIISAVLMASLPFTNKATKAGGKLLTNILEGLKYVRRNKTILYIIIFSLISIALSRPIQVLMPIFVDDILEVGATGMGFLLGISGIGAIAGSLLLASLPSKNKGRTLLAGSLVLGVAIFAFSFSSSYYLSLGTMIAVGLGQTIRFTLGNSLVQQNTEDEYRGRVMSIYSMEIAFIGIGGFAAGLLADAYGAPWTLGSFAIVLVLLVILVMVFVPRIRRLD